MEYVDGQSCAEILRERGTLPPDEAVEILAQSCRGLAYAHRHEVIHRDVKPGNLLRSRDGMVKLADFGIAKAAEQSDITKVGSVLGTAAYLAPEQARGEPAGPGSDMYALGVVAYQLMAGRLPYEAASLTDLARLQDSSPPPRLDEVTTGVSPALAAAVARALHRDPDQRYADASEMESALRDSLRGRAPAAPTGWAPAEDTAATRMLESTSATRAMPQTTQAPPRRRLEPLDEPPTRAPRRAPAPSPPRKEKSGGALRWFVGLLVVLALAAAGFAGYQALESSSSNSVQLREDVRGNTEDSIGELRGLIEDNTGD
jgi:serine/threonine-protein kinase